MRAVRAVRTLHEQPPRELDSGEDLLESDCTTEVNTQECRVCGRGWERRGEQSHSKSTLNLELNPHMCSASWPDPKLAR